MNSAFRRLFPLHRLHHCLRPRIPSLTSVRSFTKTLPRMAHHMLTSLRSLNDLKEGELTEVNLTSQEDTKLLVVKFRGKAHAMTANCTHFGANLSKGVLAPDGKLTCPWHGACYDIFTGDIEDGPAINALKKYELVQREEGVFVKLPDNETVKKDGRDPVAPCAANSGFGHHVLIVGGGPGGYGTVVSLRENNYHGPITLVTREPYVPIDRTKLTKSLISDPSTIALRPPEWYTSVGVEVLSDTVTSVDFERRTVSTESGKQMPYTDLVLATGGINKWLPLPGFPDKRNVFVIRQVSDTKKIIKALGDHKKKVVVVGSSFIGMEIGNTLFKTNDVSIVGREGVPMESIMGPQVGKIFQSLLEQSGVKFYLSGGVEKATPNESDETKVGAVHLKNGTVLPADVVILGLGVYPATEFLRNNPAIALEKDGSIKTNEHYSVPGLHNVYAIGDIATYPYPGPRNGVIGSAHEHKPYVRIEHWNVAQNMGRSVGLSIAHSAGAGGTTAEPLRPKKYIPVYWAALGAQLRYCGNTSFGGHDDILFFGEQGKPKFVAYYTLKDDIVAVASMGMDPVVSKCTVLMKRGKMPSKKEVASGVNVLECGL